MKSSYQRTRGDGGRAMPGFWRRAPGLGYLRALENLCSNTASESAPGSQPSAPREVPAHVRDMSARMKAK